MIKFGLAAAALVFSAASLACDGKPVSGANGDMEDFREQAMQQLRSENLDALRASLQRSQTALTSETRERFLASQPGAVGSSTARGAP
jgi:hypothetical protein